MFVGSTKELLQALKGEQAKDIIEGDSTDEMATPEVNIISR